MRKYISQIEEFWQKGSEIHTNKELENKARGIVGIVINELDAGNIRACDKIDNKWQVNEWAKKAILLFFKLNASKIIGNDPPFYFDKVPVKFDLDWDEARFNAAKFRVVPGAIVRKGAYIGENVVLMPSFINIGAYIGEGTMIDSWSTIGSCAQIGKNCHISGGVGIGGVLEPLQAKPVIIEDNCFIGARSEIAEGVMVMEGAVISMGVFIGASTKIIDRITGEIHIGCVPPYSVVVPGTLPSSDPNMPSLACAVIVKKVDEKTRAKTAITEILRM